LSLFSFARIIETKIENLDDIIEEMRKSQSIAVEQKLQLWAEESNENDKDVNPEEEVNFFVVLHTNTQT
jgi:hypothetical protein